MSLTELSLRWARQRRSVTSSLVAQTSLSQLEADLRFYKAAKDLPRSAMLDIDRVHMKNRLPIFASEDIVPDYDGEGFIGEPIP